MLTPDPVPVTCEAGWVLRFTLGREFEIPHEGEDPPPEDQPPQTEYRTFPFGLAAAEAECPFEVKSVEGNVKVEGIEFKVTEEMPEGRYEIKVEEVTESVFTKMEPMTIYLDIEAQEDEEDPKKKK